MPPTSSFANMKAGIGSNLSSIFVERLVRRPFSSSTSSSSPCLVGRKAVAYDKSRERTSAAEWSGFSDNPTYEKAQEIAQTLIDAFLTDEADGGVGEIHVVYTRFVNMVTQTPQVVRMLPLEV